MCPPRATPLGQKRRVDPMQHALSLLDHSKKPFVVQDAANHLGGVLFEISDVAGFKDLPSQGFVRSSAPWVIVNVDPGDDTLGFQSLT